MGASGIHDFVIRRYHDTVLTLRSYHALNDLVGLFSLFRKNHRDSSPMLLILPASRFPPSIEDHRYRISDTLSVFGQGYKKLFPSQISILPITNRATVY